MVVLKSVLEREHWQIDYVIKLSRRWRYSHPALAVNMTMFFLITPYDCPSDQVSFPDELGAEPRHSYSFHLIERSISWD